MKLCIEVGQDQFMELMFFMESFHLLQKVLLKLFKSDILKMPKRSLILL